MGLKESLEHQQKILELQLGIARERYQHHGLLGGEVESSLRAFIEANLPRSLSVGTGEVIATKGDNGFTTSRQLDVVISNEMQPFSSGRDNPTVLLIEGVNAAGEIKSVLQRSKFGIELEKGKIFKSLRANNLSSLVTVPRPDTWQLFYVHYRPYFIFAYETKGDWRRFLLDTFDFILAQKKIPYDGLFLMDAGIVVLISPFVDFPFSKTAGLPFQYEIGDIGTVMGGIHIYSSTAFLAFFLAWLSSFRSSFFGDRNPLPTYLAPVVNESLESIDLASGSVSDILSFIQSSNSSEDNSLLKSVAEYLRISLERTS